MSRIYEHYFNLMVVINLKTIKNELNLRLYLVKLALFYLLKVLV